ncbi:MAG: hypothetical protein IPJ88_13310 [Myxococcales bacterium]|nr:MAG: hypothetical protein IPJ88_13310 [Myxococcales bacterium]
MTKAINFIKRWTASCCAVLFAILCWGVVPQTVFAEKNTQYHTVANVSLGERTLFATTSIIAQLNETQSELRFWLYADRLKKSPQAMDEISARWIYPGEESLGGIQITEVRIDGQKRRVSIERTNPKSAQALDVHGSEALVRFPEGLRTGTHRIDIKYKLRLPERFGRLGMARDSLSLLGPWYPLLVQQGSPFDSASIHRVDVQLKEQGWIWSPKKSSAQRLSLETGGPYIPLQLSDEQCLQHTRSGATQIALHSRDCVYESPSADRRNEFGLDDLVAVKSLELLQKNLRQVRLTLAAFGLPVPETFPMTVGHSRTELAATVPGGVIISDRLFQIFPIQAMRAFHERALRGAMFEYAANLWLKEFVPACDLAVNQELLAGILSDLNEAREHQKKRSPRDLVGFAAFHPAVDQLLYAPQVAFDDVFFWQNTTDHFRDKPTRAYRNIAQGRRILEHLRDVLSVQEQERFNRAMLDGHHSIRQALREIKPVALGYLPDWFDGPNRPVNYRLGKWRSRSLGKGKGYVHEIEVFRDGALFREVVTVQAVDEDGKVLRGTWDERKKRGVVILHSDAPLDEVEIDPDMRLVQSAAVADGHPRADDASNHAFRPPLLQAFGLNVF